MKRLLSLLIVTLFALPATSQEATKPKLEKGKHSFDVPVMSDGLCVNNLFQSNMVIQRDKPITVWGWAAPGDEVTVSFAGQTATATTAEDRSWKVSLPEMKANGQEQAMTVKTKEKTLTFQNILIGDVWVAGGQSNMQHPLSRVEGGPTAIASANFPKIRLLTVPAMIDNEIKNNFPVGHRWENGHHREGYWDVCSPNTVREFTAIGYIFAQRLHMASQIPIGIIDASRWGTTVEAWTPLSELRKMETPAVKAGLADWDKKVAGYDPQKALEEHIKRYNARTESLSKQGHDVSGRKPPTEAPASPLVNQNHPGNCYASLIAPIAGIGVKGAIYHQGYNNSRTDAAEFYYAVMPKMIASWRAAFNNPEMAFGIVSLCTDGPPQTLDNYTESMLNFGIYVREAQYKTFLDLYNAGDKNIGFASSFDLRHAWYHPQNKLPAGERIARWALATQYGFEGRIFWKPPMVTKVEVKDDRIMLHLDNQVGPRERGAAIVGFAIAGADKKYQPAHAEAIVTGKDSRGREQRDHKVIVLTSPHVPKPIHYRYAWGRNPMGNVRPGAVNQKDILFATQRSDNWQFWEVPFLEALADNCASRESQEKIREALKLVDLERRLKDAELATEVLKPQYLDQLKKVNGTK